MDEIRYECEVCVWCLAYNHEKYIRQALDSILNQKTTFTWKLIIYDDASTDSTPAIIKEYADKYPEKILAILQKENQYQKGIEVLSFIIPYLKGKYVASCEGDDYWIDNFKLQKQYEFLEVHKEINGCYHNIQVVNDKEQIMVSKEFPYKKYCVYEKDYTKNLKLLGQTASAFYRNFFADFTVDEIKAFNNCKANGDRKIAVTIGMMGKVAYLEDIMAVHRVVINSGDSWHALTYNKNMTVNKLISQNSLREYVKEVFEIDVDIKAEEIQLLWNALMYYNETKSRDDFEILKQSWKLIELNTRTKMYGLIKILCNKIVRNKYQKKEKKSVY